MDRVTWQPDKERLIFLGDYIDRGDDSKGVVDYILSLRNCSSRVDCLIGNHESIFIDYLKGKDRRLFLLNGGVTTLQSYQTRREEGDHELVPEAHMTFYSTLKTYIELRDYYVVHAGFKPGVLMEDQTLEDMMWIRDTFIYSHYNFGKPVIFGHTPFYEPLVMENKIGLDTGAVYGNRLTCLELPERRFHYVEA
jgi:serine/threonine protein phosphatase 1